MNWYKSEFGKSTTWLTPMGKRKITFYKEKDNKDRYLVTLEKKVEHQNNTFTWKFVKDYRVKTKTAAMKYISNAKKSRSYW